MTLDEFINEEAQRVARFRDAWREANAIAPAAFPLTMPPGEWDEALAMWDGLPFDAEEALGLMGDEG